MTNGAAWCVGPLRRSISIGYSVEEVTYRFETDSTAWKIEFSGQVQVSVDLVRFEVSRVNFLGHLLPEMGWVRRGGRPSGGGSRALRGV